MDRWSTVGGLDWLQADRATGEPEEFGLLLGYGYLDEVPVDIGVGAAAFAAVTRGLAESPVKIGVGVGLASTTLVLRGQRAAVREAVGRLDAVLAQPNQLVGSGESTSRRSEWTGWSRELEAWCGAGSVSLSMRDDQPWRGSDDDLRAMLHELRARPAVGWTTDPTLVGRVVTDSSSVQSPRTTLWRDPAPTGSVRGSYDNNLVSFRVPSTLPYEIAARLAVRTISNGVSPLVDTVDVALEYCGPQMIFGLRGLPRPGETNWSDVSRAAQTALEAIPDLNTSVIENELQTSVRTAPQRSMQLRAIDAFGTDLRRTGPELIEQTRSLTPADLRAALVEIHACSLISLPGDLEPPTDRPVFTPVKLPPIEQPEFSRRARFDLRGGEIPIRPALLATQDRLQVVVTPRRGRLRRSDATSEETAVVDLGAIAFRRDLGAERTEVTDRVGRMVGITWPAYGRTEPLRALLDERIPADRRLVEASDPAYAANLRKRLIRWRIAAVVLPVALLVILVVIISGVVRAM